MCMTDIGFHWILTHECTCPTIPTTLSQCPDLRMPDIHHFHPSTHSLPHYCDPKSNKQTKNSLQLSHSKFCIMLSISCISITFGGQGKLACFSTSKMFTMLPAATARSCPLRGWNLTLPMPPCFTCTTKSMSISYNNWTTARMNSCEDGRQTHQVPTRKTWVDVVWPTVQKRISPLSSQEQRTSVNLGWKSTDVTCDLCPWKVCKAPLSCKRRNSHEPRISLQYYSGYLMLHQQCCQAKHKSIRTKQ